MMRMTFFLLVSLLVATCITKHYYADHNSNVIALSQRNWGNIVKKGITNKQIYVVHFFKSESGGDNQSYQFSENFETQSEKSKGLFNFAGVDCETDSKLCTEEGITSFPTVKIYPPIPIPAFVPEVSLSLTQAGLDAKKIAAIAQNYVQEEITVVDDDTWKKFKNQKPSVPKAILVTNKGSRKPILWKALSTAFEVGLKLILGKNYIWFG